MPPQRGKQGRKHPRKMQNCTLVFTFRHAEKILKIIPGESHFDFLDLRFPLARLEGDRLYPLACETHAREAALEEFGACWEGLEDPRTGNADAA